MVSKSRCYVLCRTSSMQRKHLPVSYITYLWRHRQSLCCFKCSGWSTLILLSWCRHILSLSCIANVLDNCQETAYKGRIVSHYLWLKTLGHQPKNLFQCCFKGLTTPWNKKWLEQRIHLQRWRDFEEDDWNPRVVSEELCDEVASHCNVRHFTVISAVDITSWQLTT